MVRGPQRHQMVVSTEGCSKEARTTGPTQPRRPNRHLTQAWKLRWPGFRGSELTPEQASRMIELYIIAIADDL